MDVTPIEIIAKKYVQRTYKFLDVFFSTYQCNIDIEWTLIPRFVTVRNKIRGASRTSAKSNMEIFVTKVLT